MPHRVRERRRRVLKIFSGFVLGAQALWANAAPKELTLKKTGWISDQRFALQAFDAKHPEQAQRVLQVQAAMLASPLAQRIEQLKPLAEVEPHLRLVHTEEHIEGIRTRYDANINTLARTAVGAGLAAVEAVARGRIRNAFVASRPPGHHATNTGQEEGFCFFNNIAVAARHAQRLGFARVLIVDWDFHHGNGTEALFYDDPSVFYFSTFNDQAYPRTGHTARTGAGKGLGFTMNHPLACGATDADVLAIYRRDLIGAASRFKPDFVLVSAGFDSRVDDLLGCFKFTDTGYREMTRIVMGIAEQHAQGRLVSMLEGGYNFAGLASAVLAHTEALTEGPLTQRTRVTTPPEKLKPV